MAPKLATAFITGMSAWNVAFSGAAIPAGFVDSEIIPVGDTENMLGDLKTAGAVGAAHVVSKPAETRERTSR